MKKKVELLLTEIYKQRNLFLPNNLEAKIYSINKFVWKYSELKFDDDGKVNGIQGERIKKSNKIIIWTEGEKGNQEFIERLLLQSQAFAKIYEMLLEVGKVKRTYILNQIIYNIVNNVRIKTYIDKLINEVKEKKEVLQCKSLITGISIDNSLEFIELTVKKHKVIIRRITADDIGFFYSNTEGFISTPESVVVDFKCENVNTAASVRQYILQVLSLVGNVFCVDSNNIISSNRILANNNVTSTMSNNLYQHNYAINIINQQIVKNTIRLLDGKIPKSQEYIVQPLSTQRTSHINIALNRYMLAVKNEMRMLETLTYSVNMLEALLLTEKDEITLRFTNRVFMLFNLIQEIPDNNEFITFIKKAYNLRSKYIHGDLHKRSDYSDFDFTRFLNISRVILLFNLLVQTQIGKADLIKLIDLSIFNRDDLKKLKSLVIKSKVQLLA